MDPSFVLMVHTFFQGHAHALHPLNSHVSTPSTSRCLRGGAFQEERKHVEPVCVACE